MKQFIILIAFGLTFGTVLFGQAGTFITDNKTMDTAFTHENLNAQLIRLILDNDVVQDAIFKISGRKMYPMTLISPSGFSLGLRPDGFRVDSTDLKTKKSIGKESILEVNSIAQNEQTRECKVILSYNSSLKITIKAYREQGSNDWYLQNILIINNTF